MKMIEISESALDTLKAQIVELEKDAARYRWLRDRAKPMECGSGYPFENTVRLKVETPVYMPSTWGRDVDRAIDAAMQCK